MKLHKSISLQLKEYILIAAFILTLGSCGENEPADPAESPKDLSQAELFDLQKALDNSLYYQIPKEYQESTDIYGYDIWHNGFHSTYLGGPTDFLHISAGDNSADVWSVTTNNPVFLISSEGGVFTLDSYWMWDKKETPASMDFIITSITQTATDSADDIEIAICKTTEEFSADNNQFAVYDYSDNPDKDYHSLMRVKFQPNNQVNPLISTIQLRTKEMRKGNYGNAKYDYAQITFYQKGLGKDIPMNDLMKYFN